VESQNNDQSGIIFLKILKQKYNANGSITISHLSLNVINNFECSRLAKNHSSLNIFAFDATDEGADLVASVSLFKDLVEHFDAGDGRLETLVVADELSLLALLEDTSLEAASDDSASAGNRVDALDGHHERLVKVAYGRRDRRVNGFHQFQHGIRTCKRKVDDSVIYYSEWFSYQSRAWFPPERKGQSP
jgi:hypothetical protein